MEPVRRVAVCRCEKRLCSIKLTRANCRPPSHALTAGLRQEGAKLRSNLEHAQKSDSFVLQKFDAHRPGMEGLAMTEVHCVPVNSLVGTTNVTKRSSG
jgi:hypothetical protein